MHGTRDCSAGLSSSWSRHLTYIPSSQRIHPNDFGDQYLKKAQNNGKFKYLQYTEQTQATRRLCKVRASRMTSWVGIVLSAMNCEAQGF